MRKRLEEAADNHCGCNNCITRKEGDCFKEECLFYKAFKAGAEWFFKDCGGMTVLHDMRKMILAHCKEWMQNYFPDELDGKGFEFVRRDEILADFEADMNKLWEGEK